MSKATVFAFIGICLALICPTLQSGLAGKYLVISPRVYRTGTREIISCTMFDMKEDAHITFRLTKGRQLLVSITTKIPKSASNRNVEIAISVPRNSPTGQANLNVKSTSKGIDETKKIEIQRLSMNLMIQTDKPIYKPGEKVQFRVVAVKPNLLPELSNMKEITIMNPSGSRMMQWKDVASKKGVVSLHFKLSDRPLLGTWKIQATLEDADKKIVKESVNIVVDKYVLPKYEVKVTPPSYLVEGKPNFRVSVCAKYTYGKPVVGKLSMNVCIKFSRKYRWIRTPDFPCQIFNMDIDGCIDQDVMDKALAKTMSYRYYARLVVQANVTENATGIMLSKTTNETKIEYNEVKLSFDGSDDSFKPGFPYMFKFSVKGPDGRPLQGKFVKITLSTNKGELKKIETVVTSGFMEMEINIPDGASSLRLNANYELKVNGFKYPRKSYGSKYVKAWYSPSKSYLMIVKPKRSFKVGEVLNIRADAKSSELSTGGNLFFFNLLCRGNTVLFGKKQMSGYGKTLRLDVIFRVTQKMVPMCRLLMYYIRSDGEFVADSVDISLEANFVNKVTVAFKEASKKPGQKVDLVMQATPGSLIGISAVDRSVQLLGTTNDITSDEVINILKSQDVKDAYYHEYRSKCGNPNPWFWRRELNRKRRSSPIMPHYGGDSKYDGKEALKNAGVVYMTNLKVDVSPCVTTYYPSRSGLDGDFALEGGVDEFAALPMPENARPAPEVQFVEKSLSGKNEPKSASRAPVRTKFPETWLWMEEIMNERVGKKILTVTVPDTMTTWSANAFAVSSETGIGVSAPSSIRVMQPFFVSLSLPYSIIRGEKATILATVFNYLAGSLTVEISLEGSSDFDFQTLTPTKICVGGSKTGTAKFSVNPKVLGRIPIKVTAVTISENKCKPTDTLANESGAADAVLRKLLVEPEGIKKELTYSTFFCPQRVGGVTRGYYKEVVPLQLPAVVVPGSVHAEISVVGDLMGPTLSGLDSLLKMPYGCGEQNMLNFAPNIYVMKYLSATGQLTSDIKTKAEEFMISGYQRELTYRRKDGSYSAFGERDRDGGSTWLTAFVLKSYAQANGLIFIDQEDLDISIKWLLKIQKTDGCFPSLGMIHHKSMKGGVSSGVTMTAFVLNALLEAGMPTTDPKIVSAVNCITAGLSSINDSYTAAIIAYTLTLAKSNDKAIVMKFLADHATKSGGRVHWEGQEKKPKKDHSWWYYQAPSADVEMTAYALMAYTTQGLSKALPIIKWLSKQRNSHGGFASTQDTCVALQALGEYAKLAYSGNMDVDVDVTAVDLAHKFQINSGNKLVLQRVKVPTVPCNVTVVATGTGCALLQSSIQYNVPKPVDEPSFAVTVKPSGVKGTLCQHNLRICTKYTGDGTTNMAIVEVKMISGFTAVTDNLDAMLQSTKSSHFRDYEVKDDVVVLYFNEIDDVCMDVIVDQENVVEDRKPANVKVYDYYATGNSAVSLYEINKCNMDVN